MIKVYSGALLLKKTFSKKIYQERMKPNFYQIKDTGHLKTLAIAYNKLR